MSSITIEVPDNTLHQMKSYYHQELIKSVPYSLFRAKVGAVTITGYLSGKVLFQGNNASKEASRWQKDLPTSSQKSLNSSAHDYSNWSMIGSDEVGNGSYFGALTVCATYVAKKDMNLLKTLGVKDSKNLSDAQIRDLAWQIKEIVPYHLTIANPHRYNIANQTRNINGILVALHNFTLQHLLAKLTPQQLEEMDGILIDEFTTPRSYNQYLQQEEDPLKRDDIYFECQGEGKHLAVACASIIARDAFLESLEKLGRPYGLILPSGAGTQVDQVASQIIRQHGVEALEDLAKLHFANTQKAMTLVNGS